MSARLPLSHTRWRWTDVVMVFGLSWVLLPGALYLWLYLLAPVVPLVQRFVAAIDAQNPAASFVMVMIDLIFTVGVLWYIGKRRGATLQDFGFRRFSILRALGLVVAIMVVFTLSIGVLYGVVQWLVPSFNPDQAQVDEFTNVAAPYAPLSLIALVIIPPLIEEPVFRGLIFPALGRRGGAVVGAIGSSLLFGLAHFQPNVVVYTFLLGLLLCFLYSRTGSIIPGIAVHMINNYIAYLSQR